MNYTSRPLVETIKSTKQPEPHLQISTRSRVGEQTWMSLPLHRCLRALTLPASMMAVLHFHQMGKRWSLRKETLPKGRAQKMLTYIFQDLETAYGLSRS